jgi:ribonuclease PH
MNVAMTDAGAFVEVQGTAEARPFDRTQLDAMLGLAERGIADLLAKQRAALGLGNAG